MTQDSNWRSAHVILVPEAGALGTVAVIRSLGRAGYRVHACASDPHALGLSSNFTSKRVVHPAYRDQGFIPWLRDYVSVAAIDVIIPSEGFLHAIAPAFQEFAGFMHLPSDPTVVYRSFSKIDVAERLLAAPHEAGVEDHHPPTRIVRRGEATPSIEDLESLGAPFYLKSDAKYCTTAAESLLQRLESPSEAQDAIDEALECYEAVIIQGFVPGHKAAAAFCLADGRVLASTDVLGIRTNPHTGGMMSLRTVRGNDDLRAAALGWLRHLEWEGVAMVECKWDIPSGRFWFIELNARYWGYLHLDLFFGVDMPRIQVDHFLGRNTGAPPSQRVGISTRHTVPGDFGSLLSFIRDRDVGVSRKLARTGRFLVDGVNPAIRSDLSFSADRKLYWIQWQRFLNDAFRGLWRRGLRRRNN